MVRRHLSLSCRWRGMWYMIADLCTGESGLFLRNCQPFPTVEYATAPESAEKLWRLSEELVGQKFEI